MILGRIVRWLIRRLAVLAGVLLGGAQTFSDATNAVELTILP